MISFHVAPKVHTFETFKEFYGTFVLSERDLILTNRYIFEPVAKDLLITCKMLYLEDYTKTEPTDIVLEEILSSHKDIVFDRIIAIGGGSVMDTAKVLSLNLGDDIDDLFNNTQNYHRVKELVLIPTTCGTGSETTNIVAIDRTRLGIKMGVQLPDMYGDAAVLIAEFIYNLPYAVFATSSIDALIHAVESYLNPHSKNSIHNDMICETAIRLILSAYKDITENGQHKIKDHAMKLLVASNLAGIAIATFACACVHALSYAFAGKYHVPHGEANYQFFVETLKMYESKDVNNKKLVQLKEMINSELGCDNAFGELAILLEKILPLKPMKEYGGSEDDLDVFTAVTIKNQQRLLKNNCVELSYDDIYQIFKNRL